MHIEAGVVNGAKMLLSYGTAAAASAIALKFAIANLKSDGLGALGVKSVFTTVLVFCFFEVLPHHPVGVSEVHLILGSSLFLLFGTAPAAIGLALGLLIQGTLFAQFDLPQYGINLTTLLMPLFTMSTLAKKIIPADIAYKDATYTQVLKLSALYQGGVISWVAFWAFYGQGFGAANLSSVASFGIAYTSVILVEPLIDLSLLAGAKAFHGLQKGKLFQARLYRCERPSSALAELH